MYAFILFIGEGIQIDMKEAIKYFKLAAEQGEVHSMLFYAEELRRGKENILEKNKAESQKLFNLAMQRSNKQELLNYMRIYLNTIAKKR